MNVFVKNIILLSTLSVTLLAQAAVSTPADCPTPSSLRSIQVFEHASTADSNCSDDICHATLVQDSMTLTNQKGQTSQWSLKMFLDVTWQDALFGYGLLEKAEKHYQKVQALASIEPSDGTYSGNVCVYRLDTTTKLIATPMS